MMDMGGIDRRAFLKAGGFGLLGGMVFGSVGCNRSGEICGTPELPNIVFIIADDLGWADVGYHVSEIKTPHIDLLAKGGVRLNQHYVMPTCTPTRVGLMTGRYPSRYGVLAPAYGKIFDEGTVTMPEAFRRCGYHTAISGKWHMGSPPECIPTKFGFESSYGFFDGQIDPYTHLYKTGRQCWHRNDELFEEEGHATDLITDEAVRVIKNKGNKPLFLYAAYSVPHYPLDEPDEWLDMYGDIEEESRRWYAASVSHMDAGIGKIVAAVDAAGMREKTIIVFVSDNGGQRSWHSDTQYKGRYADKAHTVLGDNRPLRGWKGDVFEGGIRVPGVVNWPAVLKPGKMDEPMHIVDWMPTLCPLGDSGLKEELKLDGVNMWGAIAGCDGPGGERVLYWKTPGAYAVRVGDWKLVTGKNFGKAMLFDLAVDELEERDLASEEGGRVGAMKGVLMRIAADDRERIR